MTNDTAKTAFFSGAEVVYHADGYDVCGVIEQIIYSKDRDKRVIISARLKTGENSYTVALIKALELKGEHNNDKESE